MIRIQRIHKKSLKYARRVDVSAEIEYVIPNIVNDLKKDSLRELKLPKNTLRIVFKNKESGFAGDGFSRNVKTYIFNYNIITFKR